MQLIDDYICVYPYLQIGELAGLAVGATILLNVLIAG
jgi:hypothetical protein